MPRPPGSTPRREAAARIRHPNIVQIHAVGEQAGRPYLAMEYVEGGNLRSPDGTPRPPREAARLVEAVARGVAEAHRLGVVHRDLKPANILLAADGTPKVADFGLAKLVNGDSEMTRTGSLLGSPSYMAPEQAGPGRGPIGPAVDVHALGVILYELTTGRPPFRGATITQTLDQVRSTDPVPPTRLVPALPRDLETICLKCLEKEPPRRYAGASDLADDLRRFLDGRPIRARHTPAWARAWKWARRRPALAGLAAIVLLLVAALVVGTTAAAWTINRARDQLRRTLYSTRMNLAPQAWDSANIGQLRSLLEPYRAGSGDEDLRGFEWFVWWRRANPDRLRRSLAGRVGPANKLAFSPDGKALATIGNFHALGLWEIARGTLRGLHPTPSTRHPDGDCRPGVLARRPADRDQRRRRPDLDPRRRHRPPRDDPPIR